MTSAMKSKTSSTRQSTRKNGAGVERGRKKLETKAMIAYSTGGTYDQEILAKCLTSLSEAVVSKHYGSYRGREDLVSSGVLKALCLLRAPFFDPKKNVRGFLYTGIRNEVGNLLRRDSRTSPVAPRSDHFGSSRSQDDEVVLAAEYERQCSKILGRFQACGVNIDLHRQTVRGAALYRAVA